MSIRTPRSLVFAALILCVISTAVSQDSLAPLDSAAHAADSNAQTGNHSPQYQKPPLTSKQLNSNTADGSPSDLPSTTLAAVPPGPTDRPRIGLALGGGGALGLSEIGALQWFEEHHIPIDVIAGTSMGCMIGALYSSGKPVEELKVVMNGDVFNSVFSFHSSYSSRSFRRREDSRAISNNLAVGLKHGISFRNSLLTDQGLNAFLDRQFLRYNDPTDFNTLPIPLRCLATDLNSAQTVTFDHGSIPDAVRASISIPGAYSPFTIGGHQFVDGAVLNNLPTQTIRDMRADVVLAFSLPIAPVGPNDLNSFVDVLQRSFSVAIEGNERFSRSLANVIITPNLDGFNRTDFLKGTALAERGYKATEQHKAELLKYAVSDQQWQEYLTQRATRLHGPPGLLLRIHVNAPNETITRAVQRKFAPLVNHPIDTNVIEALLAEVRSDGRYDADYSLVAEPPASTDSPNSTQIRPSIRVTVADKKTGPPFLLAGGTVVAETSGTTRGTVEAILLDQDFGGYGSELRAHIKLGFLTQFDAEYYRHLYSTGLSGGFFLAPHGGLLRYPYDIYQNQVRISQRLLQRAGGGADLGWSDARIQELRLGWSEDDVHWQTQIGNDNQPNIRGTTQRIHLRYVYDNQDRALVPQYGIRSATDFAYLYNTIASPSAPQFTTQFTLAHQIGKNLFLFNSEAGTTLNRNVAQPFRFTLGGPLRLTASAIDEYRGTDYFLVEPVFLRRIAKLPDPLGQSIYLGFAYEAGQIHAPNSPTITRQDLYFGIIAETPLGVITLAPAIGDDGHRKFIFTLGKLF